MNLNNIFFVMFLTMPLSTHAEVFKCQSSGGEMIYQSTPCSSTEIPEGKLNIKEMTIQQQQAAKAELKAEEKEEAAYDAAQAKAAKERQQELQKQEELQLMERRTRAIEQEADTERKRVLGGPGSPYWRPRDSDN